ncbi:MAG: succinylglutamate desuccinylase/aspartoacylase family protein [Halobacteria archaeon]
MLDFGTASAEPGGIDTGCLEAGELRDGSSFSLPVAAVNGAGTGKTLYIQAGSDGDEYNGVGVVRNFVEQLDPRKIKGQILVVGILNFHGFQVAEHRNPIDNKKINRVFPGNPDGSSSDRLASLVYDEGVERADLAIDLHQGSTSRMIDEVRVRCGGSHRMHGRCLGLAKSFGTRYILDKKGPDGQLARVAPDDGIPTIDPELGGSVGWDPDSIERGVTGLFNVLKGYGFLDTDADVPEEQYVADRFDTYHSGRGGLLRFRVDLYDEVEENDLLFEITDVFGNVREKRKAENPGLVWRKRRLPNVATGEYVVSVATGLEEMR